LHGTPEEPYTLSLLDPVKDANDLIDIEDSRSLAASASPEWVVLHEVDDDHPLHETAASGRLVELVRTLADRTSSRRQTGRGALCVDDGTRGCAKWAQPLMA